MIKKVNFSQGEKDKTRSKIVVLRCANDYSNRNTFSLGHEQVAIITFYILAIWSDLDAGYGCTSKKDPTKIAGYRLNETPRYISGLG